jgi:tRNA 2-(methylsulfanyl)-N6-isopentenyladenosine37 hydroxylase
MQYRLPVVKPSNPKWIETVMANFSFFLQDHAGCERKASASAMSLVAKYPNRVEIIPELIDTALEEMEHFRDVYKVMQSQGLQLQHEITEDLYVKELLKLCRTGRDEHFMDRLLLVSVIENRAAERFKLIYEHLPEGDLKKFYHQLWASEAKHGEVFVKMALNYFDEESVYKRLNELNNAEGEILEAMPITGKLH